MNSSESASGSKEPPRASLELLHETPHLWAVNKPPGVTSNRLPGKGQSILDSFSEPTWPVHRLDKDTSGVLLIAKNEAAARTLSSLFQTRDISKEYWALVGKEPLAQTITDSIGIDPRRPRKRRIDDSGQQAETAVSVVATRTECSLVCARPKTGRTHQIRVHLGHVGSPILGDLTYGGSSGIRVGTQIFEAKRPLLHARKIIFTAFGVLHEISAPVPFDFSVSALFPDLELP